MENEDASHEYAPLFDVYHHLLTVSRIFDCVNQRFLKARRTLTQPKASGAFHKMKGPTDFLC